MCYHYSLSIRSEDIRKHYLAFEEDYVLNNELYDEPLYHAGGFDHPLMPVLAPGGLRLSRWGLIPSWTRSNAEAEELSNRTLNARSETAFEKPSFRESILARRCLVPATGFFEWRTVGSKKYPYYISLKDQPVFSMAGLYDEWVDRSTGEIVHSFSILTTQANALMEMIHNTKKRMPVILSPEAEKEWLRSDLSAETILQLCRPFDDDRMQAHTISRLITSAGDKNVPEIRQAHVYPELDMQQGELF